ncbi:MAG: hypothetical protein RLZZ387_2716 [Chloroflexota bacterium]|jgi:hypothetical protein
MITIAVIVVTTAFGYGVTWLLWREPLTTADLAFGALAGFAGLSLAQVGAGGRPEVGFVLALALSLGLQALRRRSPLDRVE